MKDLRGRNAILTGASRGLGVHIARRLAAEGINLALASRNAQALDVIRAESAHAGVKAVAIAADVTSRDDLRRLVDTAERELGCVDILINNAGIEMAAPFHEYSLDQIDAVLNTNIHAPMWLTKMVLPMMLARGCGAIVNIASMAGTTGNPYISTYCASKSALIGFTESLDAELEGTGVTASAVCPTFVNEAGMWANAGAKAPMMTREVSPKKVADAVVRALHGEGIYYVTTGPIRPLLALMELAPALRKPALKRMGLFDMWRSEAERRQTGADRPGRQAPASTPATNGAASPAAPPADAAAPAEGAETASVGSSDAGGD
jgi:short-subunit dehydrogenase